MALIHDAELSPSKLEMLGQWISDAEQLSVLGAYRFDDPSGAVGIETVLVQSSVGVLHVPVTYRGAPLPGADAFLVTEMEHSVLGRRWVYNAVGDPVYVQALAHAILTGGTQADLEFDYPVPAEKLHVATRVVGSGRVGAVVPAFDSFETSLSASVSTVQSTTLRLEVLRVLDTSRTPDADYCLSGTWPGQAKPTVLAHVLRQ